MLISAHAHPSALPVAMHVTVPVGPSKFASDSEGEVWEDTKVPGQFPGQFQASGGHWRPRPVVTGGQLKDPSQEDDESRCACWFPLPDVMRELTPEAAQHGLGLDTSTTGPRYQGYRKPHEIGGVLRRFIKARASKSGPVPLLFVPPSGS